MRDLALAERRDFFDGQITAVFGLDPRHDLFAVLGVGDADDLDVSDLGVGIEELLDLSWIDVLAASDDQVLDSAHDVEITLVVHHGEVTGVHPTVFVDGLGGLVGIVPVADHHRIPLGAEFARCASGNGLAGVGVDDLHLDVRQHPADGPDSLVDRVVGCGLGADR